MKLTDNEKRDIIKHLEADKELPDKYRFLLFEEKREVELVWNSKTNEICNVVLPFQTIEHVDEPRAEKEIKAQAVKAYMQGNKNDDNDALAIAEAVNRSTQQSLSPDPRLAGGIGDHRGERGGETSPGDSCAIGRGRKRIE